MYKFSVCIAAYFFMIALINVLEAVGQGNKIGNLTRLAGGLSFMWMIGYFIYGY